MSNRRFGLLDHGIRCRCGAALLFLIVCSGAPFSWGGAAGTTAEARRTPTVEAVEKALPSVVNIGTKTRVQRRALFFDWWRDQWAPYIEELPPQESAGSGVIIDEAGYVLTNVHVVENADEITVKLVDGRVYEAEVIVGARKSDVALLRVKAGEGDTFPAARFAANGDLLLGETVLALGNPFGLGVSVSQGILSSKSRRETNDSAALGLPDWLQTDAAINPGNSGGPLINLNGEVIGINVAIFKEAQGIGFAIPIRRVNEAMSEIFTPERMKGMWFGAQLSPGTTPLEVASVQPESPAHQAGLQSGDQILSLEGEPVQGFIPFMSRLSQFSQGEEVRLTFKRKGETRTASLQLLPESEFFNASLIREKIGVSLQTLTVELAEGLGFSRSGGLVVTDVQANSPAERAGVRQNWIVTAIDDQAVSDVTAAARILYRKEAGSTVPLQILAEQRVGPFVRQQSGRVEVRVR